MLIVPGTTRRDFVDFVKSIADSIAGLEEIEGEPGVDELLAKQMKHLDTLAGLLARIP